MNEGHVNDDSEEDDIGILVYNYGREKKAMVQVRAERASKPEPSQSPRLRPSQPLCLSNNNDESKSLSLNYSCAKSSTMVTSDTTSPCGRSNFSSDESIKQPETTTRNQRWERRFQEIVEYKSKKGHCDVPNTYRRNSQLARWVNKQRNRYKSNKLLDDRFRRLQQIGFHFEGSKLHEQNWNQRFQQLVQFKKVYGHCNVPQAYDSNPSLGFWVNTQRKTYKANVLSDHHIKRLKAIGFKLS